jgi:hypothetical protein
MMLAWEGLPYLPTPNRTFLFKCARWSNQNDLYSEFSYLTGF